jgi:glycosyltransferase involved in cell wall biosynthesis
MLNRIDHDYACDRLGLSPERVSVMPNGIREHFVQAPDAEPVAGALRLCFVGSWIPRKGIDVLSGALERWDSEGLDYELLLLGTQSDTGVRESLPRASWERISLRPVFANEELPQLLRGGEILLFPSLAEGSSVALLEGMACGLAPVATRVGAAPDVIEPGSTGVLIPPADADALAGAVLELVGDRDGLLDIRRRAQSAARSHRWDDIAARTAELYERVASSTTPKKRGATASQV